MGNNSKSKITPYLYLVPCMLIFGIFLFYPFVKTIYLSLYKTNKMGQAKLYVVWAIIKSCFSQHPLSTA